MSNLKTVQAIYEAFGRGDVPTILGYLADNVEWEYGIVSTNVPWLQPRKGRDEVPKFFQSLADFEISKFEPKTFLESDNIVVVLIDLEGNVRSTKRTITEEDEVHIWHFDAKGKVARFRHRADTFQHWAASY